MEIKHHVETLDALNEIGPAWADQFENKPDMPVLFSVDETGMLRINGEPLCPVSEVDADSICIDVDFFGFYLNSGDKYVICVDWPYEGDPHITEVIHTHPFGN